MNWRVLAAGLAITAAACSEQTAKAPAEPEGPSQTELVRALDSDHKPVLHAELGGCRPGVIQEAAGQIPVQVCGFCVVTIDVARGARPWSEGRLLQAARAMGTAVFKRAFSFDQPSVAPVDGERGVWIATASPHFGLPDASADLTDAQMTRVGYERRTHLRSLIDSDIMQPDIAAAIRADAALREEVMSQLGACANIPPPA